MFVNETLAPPAQTNPELIPLVTDARITFSEARETACTCGRPTALPTTSLAAILPSHRAILTCNSLLDEDLAQVIAQLRSRTREIRLEIHLATASLPRWSQKITSLPEDVKLIIIIDKMDPARIHALTSLDSRIEEFRILPSKTYTVEFFLRELPAFVQRKIRWCFIPGSEDASPFMSVDDLHQSLAEVTRWPLSRLTLSTTQAYAALNIQAHPIDEDTVWISSEPELDSQTLTRLKTASSKIKSHEIFCYVDASFTRLSREIGKARLSKAPFYFLENCLMATETWNDFRSSSHYQLLDHFSWNAFLLAQGCTVRLQAPLGASAPITLEQFIDQCRRRYARHPHEAFYQEYFCFFEPQVKLRSLCLRGLKHASRVTSLRPYRPVKAFLDSLGEKIANYHFAVKETEQAMEKVTLRTLSRGYWSIHRLYWLGYRGAWALYELMWRVMDVLWFFYECLWRVADFFWLIYKYALSPVIGFIRTLVDQPPSWKAKPWPERWRLRTGHVARKCGWLVLKALRLR